MAQIEIFNVELSGAADTLRALGMVIRATLGWDQDVMVELQDAPGVLWLSLLVVVLAGASERIGHSAVLFVNEVRPSRMAASLLVGVMLFFGGYLIWIGTIYLVAVALFDPSASIWAVIRAVGLGYTPLFLGFLALIPYFGTGILNILYLWTFAAIAAAVSTVLDLAVWQATLASIIGGVIVLMVRSTVGRPLVIAARRLRNLAAGKRLVLRIDEAVAQRSLSSVVRVENKMDETQPEDRDA